MFYAVTGGTGFLGEHLVQELLNAGHRVRILARSGVSSDTEKEVEVVKGSITDKLSLEKAFEGVNGVFHLAGVVEHSRRREDYVYDVNVNGTLKVLQVAKELGIRRVVYASTSGTVAVSKDENYVADDASPYAKTTVNGWPYYKTKVVAEEKARAYAEEVGVELICMRPTLLLGPGDRRLSSCRSVLDLMEGRVPFVPAGGLSFVDVRDAVRRLSGLPRHLLCLGRERPVAGSEAEVSLVAQAFRVAMEKAPSGATYLLGHQNITVEAYFKRIEKFSGVPAPWLRVPTTAAWAMASSVNGLAGLFGRWDPSLDPVVVEMAQHFWYLDASKARQELGFTPRDGDTTLRDTVTWLQQHRRELQA